MGGQWVAAKGGRTFDVIDPSTADAIATVCDADIPDAMAAVDAAAKAAAAWKATPPRRRSDVLIKCFHLLLEQAEWLARLITVENGKALADARSEVAYAAEFFRWYAEEAVRSPGEFGPAPS
ncbi:aldehyde dehydrogenase family protein, partial [Rhizobium leguminosarum]|nr:aldehyde dehydrogenase family protein [Rhizobium ruizarguesonis]